MKNNTRYYSHRIKLEKLKQKTLLLKVLMAAAFFATVVSDYLRRV